MDGQNRMTFQDFMSRMLRPTYVYRMAGAKDDGSDRPMARGARTAMTRAQRQIDDLVLARAAVIADERRCAAVTEIDNPKGPLLTARCEFHRGHGKVGPGTEDPRAANVRVTADWDHGAPSAKVWWKESATLDPKEID